MNESSYLAQASLGLQPQETPLWLMRQAGRYLPEYQLVRKKAGGFLALCSDPSLAAEVTLQPIRRFGMDGAVIFSDILLVLDALGARLRFEEGEGPCLDSPMHSLKDFQSLPTKTDDTFLKKTHQAIQYVRSELPKKTAVIGFSGSPWTLFCYWAQKKGEKNFLNARSLLYSNPELVEQVFSRLEEVIVSHLSSQIQSGADVVQIFDTWGLLLPSKEYLTLGVRSITSIVHSIKALHPNTPVVVYGRGASSFALEKTGADVWSMDWTHDLSKSAKMASKTSLKAIQGNFDPALLLSTKERIKSEVHATLSQLKNTRGSLGYIANLGHGVDLHTPPEHVQAWVDAVRSFQF